MARYGKRTKVWVTPYTGSPIKYGFSSGVSDSVKATLGQNVISSGSDIVGLFFGLNSPKPARATGIDVETQGTDGTKSASSFVDVGSIAQAKAAGFTIGQGLFRQGGKTLAASAKCVKLNGNIVYAWMLPNSTAARLGANLAALGIRDIGSTDHPVWGASKEYKPQRVFFQDAQGKVSTFIDSDIDVAQLPDGFSTAGRRDVY
jgi:hypothetical protein